jgi:hypothetical protein
MQSLLFLGNNFILESIHIKTDDLITSNYLKDSSSRLVRIYIYKYIYLVP